MPLTRAIGKVRAQKCGVDGLRASPAVRQKVTFASVIFTSSFSRAIASFCVQMMSSIVRKKALDTLIFASSHELETDFKDSAKVLHTLKRLHGKQHSCKTL